MMLLQAKQQKKKVPLIVLEVINLKGGTTTSKVQLVQLEN